MHMEAQTREAGANPFFLGRGGLAPPGATPGATADPKSKKNKNKKGQGKGDGKAPSGG